VLLLRCLQSEERVSHKQEREQPMPQVAMGSGDSDNEFRFLGQVWLGGAGKASEMQTCQGKLIC
jgi:hypothetical protein